MILAILVVIHELGHAVAAHRSGVVVEEFGIGFPPRAWKKKLKNGVLLTVNWLPLGGFVKLQGEHDAARNKGDYGSVSFLKKTKILLAGVVANWLVAALLLSVLAIIGMPKVIDNQFAVASDSKIQSGPVEIASLSSNYPAQKAGFKIGDKIVRFDGTKVLSSKNFIELTRRYKGKTVNIVVNRDGNEFAKKVTLGNGSGVYFGAGLSQQQSTRATWSAPIVGLATAGQFTWATIQGVGSSVGNFLSGLIAQLSPDVAVRNRASASLRAAGDSVSGPIGILGTIFPAAEQAGATQLILLTAIISISLAVMNILPIPALDGGRWATMAVFRLFKKRLTKEREERIQAIGFSILMALVVLVTIADVSKLF